MNELSTKLIADLASKLGTTTEYLWTVLIKQAYISSLIGIGYFILVVITGVVLYKVHRKFMQQPPALADEGKYRQTYYEKNDGALMIVMVIFSVAWLIGVIVCFANLQNIFIGFYNPEYWALNKILSTVKK